MQLKLYLITISILALLGSVIFGIVLEIPFYMSMIIMFVGIIAEIAVDGATAAICRAMPRGVADYTKKIFSVSKREKMFYERLRIRSWKGKIPEIGHLTGFRKNKIAEPRNPEYIKRFLYEICYGEIGHTISIFSGCLPILFAIAMPSYLAYGIYIAVVNAVLNLLPVIVLRYNGYYLTSMFKRLKAKEVRV